jgi:hypothetical protein
MNNIPSYLSGGVIVGAGTYLGVKYANTYLITNLDSVMDKNATVLASATAGGLLFGILFETLNILISVRYRLDGVTFSSTHTQHKEQNE